jgi:hypothetical protein
MNNIIENKEQQFANGQVCRNLGVNSEATEPEAEFEAMNVIEQRLDVAAEEFPAPIGKLLGLMITSSGTGQATVEFEASGRYANPMEHFMAECSAIWQMPRWASPTAAPSPKARRSPPSN